MSTLATNAITDAAGGNTATINSYTPTESNMAGRNRIINGNFDIWQRGTSFGPTSTSQYTADRWYLGSSSETCTVTQESFTAGQTDVPQAQKYLRLVVTTANNFAALVQRIEDVESLGGQTVTLSFYARGGQGGQGIPTTFRTFLNQNFGSGGSTNVNAGSTNHTLTSSWQKFTSTISIPSVASKTIGASSYTEVYFQQTTGEACDFDIAQVQLEVGSVATPFERRLYGQELALCQRYFQIVRNGNMLGNSTTGVIVNSMLSPTMRATPSLSQQGVVEIGSGTADRIQSSVNTIFLNGADNAAVYLLQNYAGITTTAGYQFRLSANTNGVTASAEL